MRGISQKMKFERKRKNHRNMESGKVKNHHVHGYNHTGDVEALGGRVSDIFNFQAFWFIVLLLLVLEWSIRKNKGLL